MVTVVRDDVCAGSVGGCGSVEDGEPLVPGTTAVEGEGIEN